MKHARLRLPLAILLSTLFVVLLMSPIASSSAATPPVTGSASPSVFSPDGDGIEDTMTVSYKVAARSRIYVRIYDSRGNMVRALRKGAYIKAGSYRTAWNGRTDAGTEAPAGSYRWLVMAKASVTTRVSGYVRSTRSSTTSSTPTTTPATPAPTPTPSPATTPPPATPTVATVASPSTDHRWVGFYIPGAPLDITRLSSLESQVATKATVSHFYQNTSEGFTWTRATYAADHGSIPLITLEFWNPAYGVSQPSYGLKAIASGTWDPYLRSYAQSAKAFGRTIWLRPLHEMNGDWYPWCGTVNGNTPADFSPAWRHIHDVFAQEGATNVKFVWCPNADNVPNKPSNLIPNYWPGDDYVDYVALDGYNWGTSRSWSSWRSFGDVFGPAYSAVTALTAKPVFIAETGCSPSGGDKAAWISDMFRAIPQSYPRIWGVTWFNANKETDWRIESSADGLAAYRTGAGGF